LRCVRDQARTTPRFSETAARSEVVPGRYLLFGLWIDRLIDINPKHTRKKCQHRSKGQEKQGCPDCDLIQTPSGQNPKDCPKSEHEGEGQTVTDVHGAEKVSWLAVEEKTAAGTAIIHLWEAPVNGGAEDSAGPASRTKLAEDAAQSGWLGTRQESTMLVDWLSKIGAQKPPLHTGTSRHGRGMRPASKKAQTRKIATTLLACIARHHTST